MLGHDKVVWSEGMFLRPQHLQQHDRYLEAQFRGRMDALHDYGWGFQQLSFDQSLLERGVLAINRCKGLMPDGGLFQVGQDQRLLREIQPGCENLLVYLALPIVLVGTDEIGPEEASDVGLTRWYSRYQEVSDSNLGCEKTVSLEVAKPRLKLLLEAELSGDYTSIPVALIKKSYTDGRVQLDEQFIAPCIRVNNSSRLCVLLEEIRSMLTHRAQAIAARLNGKPGQRGSSELADFLLLQLINGYGAQLQHLATLDQLHPERLFCLLTSLQGELATFTQESKLPGDLPAYEHRNLTSCFHHLTGNLRQALSLVFEQSAFELPLQLRRFGVRVAPIPDRQLIDKAQFFLAVKCKWNREKVRARMPTLLKVGGVEQLQELVNLQLPGIRLVPLPMAPRQIPYGNDYSYFQLEKTGEHWAQLKASGGIAFHCSGDIPELTLELWAVKDKE